MKSDTEVRRNKFHRIGMVVLTMGALGVAGLLAGCYMTPEDKAFYGRGWVNPDELDKEPTPPSSFTNPHTAPVPSAGLNEN